VWGAGVFAGLGALAADWTYWQDQAILGQERQMLDNANAIANWRRTSNGCWTMRRRVLGRRSPPVERVRVVSARRPIPAVEATSRRAAERWPRRVGRMKSSITQRMRSGILMVLLTWWTPPQQKTLIGYKQDTRRQIIIWIPTATNGPYSIIQPPAFTPVGTFLQDGKIMRKMIMRSAPPQGYHDPEAAISRSLAYNSENRTIPDSDISGKKIRAVLCGDTAIVFELDDGRFLNAVARDDRVECALSEIKEEINGELDESILLDLGGGEFQWDRRRIATSYVGRELYRLWFNPEGVYIYVRNAPILLCNAMVSHPDGNSKLFWAESD